MKLEKNHYVWDIQVNNADFSYLYILHIRILAYWACAKSSQKSQLAIGFEFKSLNMLPREYGPLKHLPT